MQITESGMKQKEEKKRMKQIGQVEALEEAFLEISKLIF